MRCARRQSALRWLIMADHDDPLAVAFEMLTRECAVCATAVRLRKTENGKWYCRACWPRETPGDGRLSGMSVRAIARRRAVAFARWFFYQHWRLRGNLPGEILASSVRL